MAVDEIRHHRLFLCGYLRARTVDSRSHGFIMGTLPLALSGSMPLVTGIIVDPDGYIITNAHRVEAQHVRVILPPPAADSPLKLQPIHAAQILEARLLDTH
jgi:S1-C subfamily serine protease